MEQTENQTTTLEENWKQDLREYIDLSTQIKNVKAETKIITSRLKELSESIKEFMLENSIDELKTQQGSIKLTTGKSKASLNEEYLRSTMVDKLDAETLDSLIEIAFKLRPTTDVQRVKLGNLKKEKK